MQMAKKKIIKYTSLDRKAFFIQFPNSQQLLITIQDHHKKLFSFLRITPSLLQPYKLSTSDFYQQLNRQRLFQEQIDNWMILVNNSLVIKFTFPLCLLKEVVFACKTEKSDEGKDKIVEFEEIFKGKVKILQEMYQDLLIKIEEKGKKKLREFQHALDQRIKQRSDTLQTKGLEILTSFDKYSESIRELNEQKYEQHLNHSVSEIIQQNTQMIQQFSLIKHSLEKEMQIINTNIQEQSILIAQLEIEINQSKQIFQDQQFALKKTIQTEYASLSQKIEGFKLEIMKKIEEILYQKDQSQPKEVNVSLKQSQLISENKLAGLQQPYNQLKFSYQDLDSLLSHMGNRKTKKRKQQQFAQIQ